MHQTFVQGTTITVSLQQEKESKVKVTEDLQMFTLLSFRGKQFLVITSLSNSSSKRGLAVNNN